MCDDTGLFQHAVFGLPDRHHGYCVDDNARALLLCCGQGAALAGLAPRFAAFIQHAWNPDLARFRNFLGFNRHWLEPQGSQDSHGRTLWALGVCGEYQGDPLLARWAAGLFAQGMDSLEGFSSPRAWAFALLGLAPYCRSHPRDTKAAALRHLLAGRLMEQHGLCADAAWPWFEDRLTYDNARLCEALIVSGAALGDGAMVETGLASLRWLLAVQSAPQGHFRPVGSHGFLLVSRGAPMPFDQQPVEACATIAACLAASRVAPSSQWRSQAQRALGWFLGDNDLGLPLVDPATGSCRDGLHPDRANENRGAESLLAWLLSLADMRAMTA
jgi:hypothetical protein